MIKQTVYQIVTDQIIKKLDEGIVPWRMTWSGGMPKNFVSKRAYTGINSMLLSLNEYECPYWVTFKQCQKLKGKVKKGEHGSIICFFKNVKGEEEEKDKKDKKEEKGYWILRYYKVFNLEQCEDIEWERKKKEVNPIKECENIVSAYKDCPKIEYGGGRAAYNNKHDLIKMPIKTAFDNMECFYSTLFHEMGHSTGHEKRIDRVGVTDNQGMESENYSKEELIAEFTSAFLCGHSGISPSTIENSAAYIDNWKQALKDDSKLLVSAGSKAQKATDYILGNSKP